LVAAAGDDRGAEGAEDGGRRDQSKDDVAGQAAGLGQGIK
jgi:hypothetical protein